jgi:protein CrcB
MILYLWVALGSALGGVARFGFGLMAARFWGESFPWGTIAINILGSFIIGFFETLTLPDGALPANLGLRTFVMVGICGGFTTFSSFSLQTFTLARDGTWFAAMGNVLLSVTLCLLAVTAGNLSAERIGRLRTEASAMPHSILAILDRTETARPVLAAAKLAADRLGEARIDALHLRHAALEGFMPTEEVMTEKREAEIEGLAAQKSADMKEVFNAWRLESGIGDWREVVGETAKVIADAAAKADLIVLGRAAGTQGGDARQAVHVALFEARLTTLFVQEAVPISLGRSVAVAWKPSEAANRAIDAALPLLLRAEQVTVLVETEDGDDEAVPASQMRTLEQAGVPLSVVRFQANGRKIGEALLAQAHAVGADLLVMGAYTHSRLAEFILGGATREVLAAADLPVLMHH